MGLNITELKQKRNELVGKMREEHERMLQAGGENSESVEKFEKYEKDIRGLENIIEREEKLVEAEARSAAVKDSKDPVKRLEELRYPTMGVRATSRAEMERRISYLLQGWLRSSRQDQQIEQDHIDAAKFFNVDLRQKEIVLPITKHYRQLKREFIAEQRALNITDATKGQETIPEGFVSQLEEALLTFSNIRQVAEVMRTDMGNDLPWPTVNDTSNEGELLDEATDFGASVDPAFGHVTFKAFKYSSKPVLISSEMLQDSAFDLGARIGEMLGIRIARIQNRHFTTGAGTTLPKGLTVAGTLGKSAADPTAFTGDELVDLEHSVDPAYRSNPGTRFMFHDLVLAAIRKLKISTPGGSGDQQYIWQPGLQAGVPDRLLGYQYVINQHMASTFTANSKLVLFGDMSKYKIRDVATIRLKRLEERYAELDQVAFIAYMRSDGNLVDAGTHPVKWLALAAS